jgi:hypothetical protein
VFLDEADSLETVLTLRYNNHIPSGFQEKGKLVAGELLIVHDYRRKSHSVSSGQPLTEKV